MPAAAALTPESAATLLEKQRYDAAILPQLEAYVDAQCSGEGYDLDANLAVLKLYQFHPEQLKVPTVAKILVKALMNLPSTDYLACTYLLPERVLDEEPISTIAAVAAKLESCSFREVWAVITPMRSVLSDIPGFDAAIRKFMLGTVEITYQSVPVGHLRASLGLEADDELQRLIKARGWTVSGDLVKIPSNDDNTAKPKRVDAGDAMRLDQMSKILGCVAASSS
jgi:translation initiation factor 3 subunit K